MADSVGEALPREMTRVRTKVLPAYYEILKDNPLTIVTINLINASLDRAQTALAEGDVLAILLAHEDLKGWEL
jgi:molybdopterin converting factor small subunit